MGNALVIEYAQFCDCSPGPLLLKAKPRMAGEFRKMRLPGWILLPAICACTAPALIVWETGSLALGLTAGPSAAEADP
jgi:hypothetical protein